MTRQRILAFDIGTSGVKVVVTDTDGTLLDSAFATYGVQARANGWVDQSLEEILAATVDVGRCVVARARAANSHIVGISVTAQMFNIVPVDATGQPLLPMLSWLDQRAAADAIALAARMPPHEQFDTLGSVVSAKDILPKILWLRDHEPEVFARAAWLLDCKEAVVMWLTGRAVTDRAGASAYRLCDRAGQGWNLNACQELGVPVQMLPAVHASTAIVGPVRESVARELGLDPGTLVVVGAGDVPASQAGAGAIGPGDVHVSLGTAIYFGVTMDEPGRDPSGQLGVIGHMDPNLWILWLEIATGGAALAWLGRNLGLDESGAINYAKIDCLVASSAGEMDDLLFAPWLSGERVPVFDDRARAAFVGIGLNHGPAHLLRAVMEGVAFQMRWALEYGQGFGQPIGSIRAVGGGSVGTEWLQIMADVLGRPLHAVKDPQDAGAVGAAACALVGLGLQPDFGFLRERAAVQRTYLPDPARTAAYTDRYATYRRLYDALHPVYHSSAPQPGLVSRW